MPTQPHLLRSHPRTALVVLGGAILALVAALGYGAAPGAAAQAQQPPRPAGNPAIAGVLEEGREVVAINPVWEGNPHSFAFQWLRCDRAGERCAAILGETRQAYRIQDLDVGATLRVSITATNEHGATTATSASHGPVAAGPPPGVLPAAGGLQSIPASSVNPPHRLVVDRVVFSPNPVRSRARPITVSVRVRDTRGYVVRDALVFVRSTPLVTSTPAERATGHEGTVAFQVQPRAEFPLRTGHNVQFFIRARKASDPLLTGVSTRRLVQVRTATPR